MTMTADAVSEAGRSACVLWASGASDPVLLQRSAISSGWKQPFFRKSPAPSRYCRFQCALGCVRNLLPGQNRTASFTTAKTPRVSATWPRPRPVRAFGSNWRAYPGSIAGSPTAFRDSSARLEHHTWLRLFPTVAEDPGRNGVAKRSGPVSFAYPRRTGRGLRSCPSPC